jgi:zinc D-Ala-D-Ala carboxypeptidase
VGTRNLTGGVFRVGWTWTLPTFYTNPEEDKTMPPVYTYFKPEEVIGLEPDFVAKLDMARAKTVELDPEKRGVPFIITSGLRTPEKNQSVIGSVPDSAHLKGLAVDLQVHNSHEVSLILDACKLVGITRRGIYVDKSFQPIHVHIDMDSDKPDQVVFIKQEQNA